MSLRLMQVHDHVHRSSSVRQMQMTAPCFLVTNQRPLGMTAPCFSVTDLRWIVQSQSAVTCGMISPTIRTAVTDSRMAATGVSSRSMKIGSACRDRHNPHWKNVGSYQVLCCTVCR